MTGASGWWSRSAPCWIGVAGMSSCERSASVALFPLPFTPSFSASRLGERGPSVRLLALAASRWQDAGVCHGTPMICLAGAALALLPLAALASPTAARALEATAPSAGEASKAAAAKRCADLYHSSGHPCAWRASLTC